MPYLKEISISTEGELSIGPDGDIAASVDAKALSEHILIRLKTVFDSSLLMPKIGSTIPSFIGLPNTLETGTKIEEEVLRALTFDGFFSPDELYIKAMPISATQIELIVEPTAQDADTLFFDIDLEEGLIR